jgi:hypothetical protein
MRSQYKAQAPQTASTLQSQTSTCHTDENDRTQTRSAYSTVSKRGAQSETEDKAAQLTTQWEAHAWGCSSAQAPEGQP